MQAKYSGQCQCGARFKKGAEIEYNRIERRVTECPACTHKHDGVDLGRMFDMAYEDQCRDICGL